MTASALDSDRQKCLKAGMHDYVCKPFRIDDLTHRLRQASTWVQKQEKDLASPIQFAPSVKGAKGDSRLVPPMVHKINRQQFASNAQPHEHQVANAQLSEPQTLDLKHSEGKNFAPSTEGLTDEAIASPIEPTSPAAAQADEVLDLTTFNALVSAFPSDAASDLIDIYLETAPQYLRILQSSLKDDTIEQLNRSVHSFKSSSATLGALHLASLCKQLESITYDELAGTARLESNDLAEAERLIQEILLTYPEVEATLKQEQSSLK